MKSRSTSKLRRCTLWLFKNITGRTTSSATDDRSIVATLKTVLVTDAWSQSTKVAFCQFCLQKPAKQAKICTNTTSCHRQSFWHHHLQLPALRARIASPKLQRAARAAAVVTRLPGPSRPPDASVPRNMQTSFAEFRRWKQAADDIRAPHTRRPTDRRELSNGSRVRICAVIHSLGEEGHIDDVKKKCWPFPHTVPHLCQIATQQRVLSRLFRCVVLLGEVLLANCFGATNRTSG